MNNTPVNPYSHKDANQDFQQTVIPHPTESSNVLGKFDDKPVELSTSAQGAKVDDLIEYKKTDSQPIESPQYKPTKENAQYFSAVVAHIDTLKENKESEDLRKANVLEGICKMSPQLEEMAKVNANAVLQVFFGVEKSKSIDAMEQVLKNINDSIEEDRENELLFDSMSDKDKRAFIELQYKDRLQTGMRIVDTPTGYQQTITDYRKATDDEFKKWSGEYIDTLKYKQFWQARSLCGADNMRLAFALSTIESESGFETFKDDVGKLSDEEKFRVYIVARGLAKKKDYWNSVLSRWGEGWKSVGSFIADIATFKTFELNAIKFTQFVDKNGGVDAVKNNPELLRKLFRTGDLGEFNTTTEEASGEKLAPLGVRYYAESESDAMSKVKKIYDAGKRQISARKTLREMQLALSDNYKSNGYIEDRIADGVFYALEAGQFALTAIGTGGVGFGIKVASATAKLGKMVSVAEKLATASKVAYKGANYSMYGHKLVMPYFYARMAHDAQQSAIDAGLDDTQAFMYGSAVGLINSYLEKIQFNLTLKNVFLGSKVVDLLANGKSALTQITLQHALQSAKRRATIFGQEYLIETLQNANDELGLFFSAKLAEKEYIEFEEVMNRLTQQGKDMIIPLLVSTNIGAGRGNFVSDVAKGVKFKNDPSAFRRYMGAVHFNEAMTHLEKSGIPNISEKDAFDFVDAQNDLDKAQADFENAETQEEKDKAQAVIDSAKATQDKILGNLDEKQRRQAEKSLMDFASETAKGVNEIIESVVEKVKSSSDAKALPAPVDHELNKRFIHDYAKWVGIQDDIIYLETLNDAGEDVIETMKSKLRNEGKSENEINDILFGEKGIDGIRFNGKIYIVGGKTKSTSRTLEVLKHETGHRGADKIRETAEYKTFLDKLLDSAGGEAIVREALSRAKGGAYDTYERYDLAEEFMCTLAEKVKGGNELTKEELSTWAKIVNFFVELLADIPENPKFRDRHIANLIRAIWKEEYLEDTPEAFDFEAESDLESSSKVVEKEASEKQKKKAKQNFRMKILRMRLREKSLTDSEREELEEKIRIQEWLDTIPDENVAEKLEAISSVEDEYLLSDEILLYAVENGATWADEALTRRHNEQEEKELKKGTQSLLSIMESNNIKLPTPKAIRDYCKANGFSLSSTLHGEINDIYSGLKLDVRQKYFSKHYREIDSAFIDELNTDFGFDYKDVSEFLQDFADNVWGLSESRFSFVDNGGNAEAKRQYDEVVAKYKGTPLWMKAPNGEPTKLTEEQWVMVRTPNFKKWFGDWETLAEYEFLNGKEVAQIIGDEISGSNKKQISLSNVLSYWSNKYKAFKRKENEYIFNSKATSVNVIVNENTIKATISKKGRLELKNKALACIGEIIENGIPLNLSRDWKGKGHQTFILSAPIKIAEDMCVASVVIKRPRAEKHRDGTEIFNESIAYIIDAIKIERLADKINPVGQLNAMGIDVNKSTNLIDNVLQNIWNVNKKDVSKVVDENGEPLVVYHGTSSTNDDYSNFTIFKNEDNQHFFSDEKDVANSMGEYLYESFLNIKKPFEIDANGDDFGDLKNHKGGIVHFSKLTDEQRRKLAIAFDVSEQELEENWGNQDIDLVRANVERRIGLSTDEWAKRARAMKYDGVVFTRIRDGGDYSVMQNPSTVYVAFNSNQIKSATDNVGTFDSANDDIRFSYKETRSQKELDELNAKFRDLYEQYKNTTAFERLKVIKQAMDLVKEEAERKGYVVKVYHGTGADGFNVAKADSSEEQNGEGNQAHGAGLYMAVSRDTAERYQSRAEKDTYYVIAGKKISEYGFDDLGLSKGYIYEIFTVAKSGGVEREIKEYESRLKLKKGFLEDLKESLPEQQKDPDFSMMMFNSAVQSYEFDINRYKKVIEGLEHLQNVLEENGLDESDIELAETEGHLFNWLTNLNDDNTLDEDWAIYQHEKPVQEAYKKAYEEDILPILKESYGFDEDELESAKKAFDTSREVGDIVRSARTYIGADKFREIMLKHGIKGLTYDGRQDGRCYVSFEGGGAVKLQDPFTFDDNGELIPLSERFDEGNADMRFSLENGEGVDRIIEVSQEDALNIVNESINNIKADNNSAYEKWLASRKDSGWFYDKENEDWVCDVNFDDVSISGSKPDENSKPIYWVGAWGGKEFDDLNDAINYAWEYYSSEHFIEESEHIVAFNAFIDAFNKITGESKGIVDTDRSNKSESRYCEFYAYTGDTIKVRFSDHELPDRYEQSDFDVWGTEDLIDQFPKILDAVKELASESEKERIADDESDMRFSFVGENSLMNTINTPDSKKIKYTDLRDFLKNGIQKGKSTFFDFGVLPDDVVARIKNETGVNLSGYTHSLDSAGILHGEKKHASEKEKLRGQVPIKREDWGIADFIVKNFDKINHINEGSTNGNDILVFQKQIGDIVYYVAEIRTGRKKIVSATMWKHKEKSFMTGESSIRNPLRPKRLHKQTSRETQSENNSESQADFSYTDNDILQKKRELSVDLAKKIYNRISKDIDFDFQNKEHRKLLRPTEDDRDFVFNADLSMLDDDVDFVLDRAEAILWKLINGSPKKSLQNDFDRYAVSAEKEIENSRIFDAVIKDALNEFKKESKLQAKLKAQIQKDAEKQANAVVGYNLDELAVNGVDLLDVIANANEDDITNAIEEIFAFCDDWANSEGLSFDMAFAKKRATLVLCFDDIANQLTYGRHFKSAVRAIEKLRSIEKESVLKNQSIRLAKRFAEYLIEQTQELEKIKLETQELEEKAKQKKEKEKLEREAKLLEKKRQRAIKLFKKFALGQKLPVANKLDIKRPLPAKVQAYLAQIKKVIGKSADEVAERYQFLQQKALDRNSENKPIDFRERYEMSALMIYGNIAEKSLAEILFAYDELKQLIAGEKDKQFERQEKLEAQVAETAEPLVKALKLAGYNKGKSGGGFSFVSREISMFEHGLRNIFLTKKGVSDELRQQVENWVVETARQVGRSALGERRFHEDEMIWLKNILAKCYGDAEKGFARLTHIDDKLAKFSSVAGRPMSIGQIMQIVCTLEQWQVKEAIKQAEKKYLNKDADLTEEDLRRYHYWKFLKDNDANMRSFLSESDLSFIQALKMRYADRYNKINPLYEELNGVPMIANGSNYIPIVREGDYTLGETKRVVAVFPAYYTPRTISLKEIDEDANILHIFINRTREDAHFLNFAKLTFMSQELTANYDFNQAIKLNMSDNERAWFNDMMTDVLTGKIAHSDSANKKLVSFFSKVSAYAGLMYNLTSAVKQVSALPAFLLQVDSKEFVNGLKLAIENGEFWTAMREFLGSDYMQDRYRSGEVNQILAEITKAETDNNVGDSGWRRFRRMFVKFGFMPISAMDWLSHALCGTMLYYSTYKKYAELYPEDEAKRLAIMDTCSVGEMTQQSAMIHNLGETQRSGESMMKMFTQFRTANRQYMSYEINALGEFISNPSWARFRRAGKTVVLNHLVLPALFNGIGLFMDALLGDDIDDDDWEYFWKSTALKCFLDVFTGWYISAFFGEAIKIAFLNQYGKSADTMMSSTAFFRIVDTCVFAMRDLTKNGLDDFDLWEHLDKLGRASFAPYRLGRKLYKNATDNKEGSIW